MLQINSCVHFESCLGYRIPIIIGIIGPSTWSITYNFDAKTNVGEKTLFLSLLNQNMKIENVEFENDAVKTKGSSC